MPPIQTSYRERHDIARAGHVVNMETQNSITRINDSASGVLGFGHPVFQGPSDKSILIVGGVALEAAAAARAGNTGNGLITAAPPVTGLAAEGTYTLVAEEAPAANAGTFRFEDPEGVYLGTVKVGVAATLGGIGPFTIADGATDFVAGDTFEIEVTSDEGAAVLRGITIEDKTLVRREGETVDTFRKGDNVALLTAGVIWVRAGGAIKAGDPAGFDPATKRYLAGAGVPLPNCSFDTSAAANGDFVQLRVSHL